MASQPRRRKERLSQYEDPAYLQLQRRLSWNLRALRLEQGLTQEEAGARCGMAMQQFQKLEAGQKNVTFTTLARLSKGLGVDAADLLAKPPASTPRLKAPGCTARRAARQSRSRS